MKKLLAILLAVLMLVSMGACGKDNSDEAAVEQEVLGATIVYAKQYYAYRVEQYSTVSTYSKSVTVYDEGVALYDLVNNAARTETEDPLDTVWGYRIQFYDTTSEKMGTPLLVTVDGKLHQDNVLYELEDPTELLDLLADTVKPTNIDAVSQN